MKLNRKQAIRFGFIVLSSFAVLSCGDKVKQLTDKVNETVADASAASKDETSKYNGYIDFYNQYLITTMNKRIDNYLKEAGEGETLNKKEMSFYYSNYSSWDRIEKNIKAKPSMKELDAAAAELVPTAKELDKLFTSAADYYKAKDYLDDKYAKGQELHTQILAAAKKYDAAYTKFDVALRNKEVETRTKEMEQAKKKGNEITYNRMLVLLEIDKIMNEISSQKLNAVNVLTADLSKIKPLYEEFNKVQKTLREKAQDEAMMKKEGYDSFSKSSLESYISKTTDFKAGILEFIERVESKKPVDEFRLKHNFSMDNEEGTPEKLYKIREEVISSYNRIR